MDAELAEALTNAPSAETRTAQVSRDPCETGAFGALFGRGARIFAGVAVVGSFLMPPHGIGFSICLFNHLFDLPCPGCGLSRSFACLSHLRFHEAVQFHPFGPAIYGWAWLAVIATVAGPARRARAAAYFARHPKLIRATYGTAIAAFLVFGFTRLALRIWWRFHPELG